MKRSKAFLAAAIISASFLAGCGMGRDGYISDEPHSTQMPMESPSISTLPEISPNVSDGIDEGESDDMSPAPSASPEIKR